MAASGNGGGGKGGGKGSVRQRVGAPRSVAGVPF